jgi:hypothetical protein
MAIPDDLKFDVRVRDRLLSRGLVTEAEIEKHVKALPDLEGHAVELTPKQPALQKESDRDIVIVRTSGVRPPIAPIVHDDSDLPIDDDIDDDDDDLDGAVKAKKPEKVVAKPAAESVDADEEEDDDDDEDDEDEDEDEDEEKADGEEKVEGEEKPEGEEKAETLKDDDWGTA